MTDRLAVTQDRLKNWGRWARDENPHIWYPTSSSGFGAWIPDGDDEGHADADGAKEAKWTAPDRKDAELIDVEIMKIGARNVIAIKNFYYRLERRREVSDEAIGAAVRALADRLYPIHLRIAEVV